MDHVCPKSPEVGSGWASLILVGMKIVINSKSHKLKEEFQEIQNKKRSCLYLHTIV